MAQRLDVSSWLPRAALVFLFPLVGFTDGIPAEVSIQILPTTFLSRSTGLTEVFSTSFLFNWTTATVSDMVIITSGVLGNDFSEFTLTFDPTAPYHQTFVWSNSEGDAFALLGTPTAHNVDFRLPGTYSHDLDAYSCSANCQTLGFNISNDPVVVGNEIVTAVPEASSLSLFAVGMFAVSAAFLRSRRYARKPVKRSR